MTDKTKIQIYKHLDMHVNTREENKQNCKYTSLCMLKLVKQTWNYILKKTVRIQFIPGA